MSEIHLFDEDDSAMDFAAGDVVFRQGEPGDCMYAVVRGEVEILVGDTVYDTTGPGGIVGEMAVIDAGPRSATARARTAARLVPVNQRRFLFLVQQTPFFAIQVMKIMSARQRQRLGSFPS